MKLYGYCKGCGSYILVNGSGLCDECEQNAINSNKTLEAQAKKDKEPKVKKIVARRKR